VLSPDRRRGQHPPRRCRHDEPPVPWR